MLTKKLAGNNGTSSTNTDAKTNAELRKHHRGLNATQCELAAKLTDNIGTDKRVCLLKERTKDDMRKPLGSPPPRRSFFPRARDATMGFEYRPVR